MARKRMADPRPEAQTKTKMMKCPRGWESHCVGCQHREEHPLVRGCSNKPGTKCPVCIEEEPKFLSKPELLNPSIWHPEELEPIPGGAISIPMKRIRSPAGAIRESFEPLVALKESIKRMGLLQPLGVRPLDPEWREFEPVIGCRRYLACSQLKMEKVPCYIKLSLKTDDIAAIALEENTFRKNLTLKETYKAVSILVEKGHSEMEIANISGMGIQNARAYIRLPSMPQQIRNAFFGRDIRVGNLVLLSGLNNDAALKLLERIKSEKLSVASVKQIIQLGRVQTTIPEKIRAMFGKNLFVGEGRRGVFLKISADDKQELCQILRSVFKSIDGLCAMEWHEKFGRKRKVK